jgi:hypothetical protein
MKNRRLIGGVLVAAFVAVVVQASAANQCPASALGACAKLHLEFMRSRTVAPIVLAASPMRASRDRG